MKLLVYIIFIFSTAFIFEVDNAPKSCLLGKRKGKISRTEILKNPKLEVLNNKYDRYKIISFEMYFISRGMDVWEDKSNSDSLTKKMINLINNKMFSRNVRIWFERIKIIDNTNQNQYLDTLSYFDLK